MDYRYLGRSALRVSPLCLGAMMFGGATDETASRRIIGKARDQGVNFIDTADGYNGGASEEVVGRGIAAHRDHWVLATKFGHRMGAGANEGGQSRKWIFQDVEASLRKLGTDYIDLLYFHKADVEAPFEEGLRAIQDLIAQGKLRYYGVSNFKGWRIAEICRAADAIGMDRPVASQPLYNMVDRLSEVEQFPAAGHYGLGVVPYSPLARGILSGKYARDAPAARGFARRPRRRAHPADRMAPRIGRHRPGRRRACRRPGHDHRDLRARLGASQPLRQRGDRGSADRGAMGRLSRRARGAARPGGRGLRRRPGAAGPCLDAGLYRPGLSDRGQAAALRRRGGRGPGKTIAGRGSQLIARWELHRREADPVPQRDARE
ncbi:MAG: aldo/keto reductase [Sphingomonas sp.]